MLHAVRFSPTKAKSIEHLLNYVSTRKENADMKRQVVLLLLAVMSLTTLPACREKGPAEKAGEKIDKAVDDVKDKAKEAADKVSK